jgi:sec-independent protein translocase protein TatC
MALLKPDIPVPLGDHLDELRRRLIWPAVVWGAVFVVAFAFQRQLKELFIMPLIRAVDIVTPEVAARAGVVLPSGEPLRVLKSLTLGESMGVSMSLAMWAAFAVVIPLLVWQFYAFVALGLNTRERRLAFLLVPAAVLLFYAGTAFGYYVGMPYIYAWFIEWTADDPISIFDLRLASYRDDFFLYTLVFGALFMIPWAIVTVCRVGFATPEQLARWRKIAFMASVLIAALIGPGDPFIMLVLMVPTYALFEIGLLVARFVRPPARPPEQPHA